MILVKCDRCGEMVPDAEDYYTLEVTREVGDNAETEKQSYDLCRLCYIDFGQWFKIPVRKE